MSSTTEQEKFQADQAVDLSVYSSRWEALWSAGLQKGQLFDCGSPSPALVDLLTSGQVDVKEKRVLVPGCGRGYDLVAFNDAGAAESLGLELSSSAVSDANAYLKEAIPAKTEACSVVMGDFYVSENGTFDFGFDYTFFCAMHPSQRPDWAARWARAIKPGGTLIALIFPVDPSRPNEGPPFPVKPELYEEHLIPAGFECMSIKAIQDELSHAGRAGKEFLGLWRRK